jgi:hypothetical protein
MFVIGANSASTGYNLTRSLRTRASASGYLTKTFASSGNRKTWTWSYWIKRGTLSTSQIFLGTADASGNYGTYFYWLSGDTLRVQDYSTTGVWTIDTTQVFRDPSSWYHIVLAVDTTQATASNRVKIYVNGSQVTALATATYPTLNYDCYMNSNANPHSIGRMGAYNSAYGDMYMAETYFIDGQALTPSSFGSTNALTGVWQPAAYTGSYGTNGFYLPFTDNSALTTSSNVGLGKDFSGNGNYFATNNISITAGVTYDSMTDVPTLTSATAANFAVLNPLDVTGVTGRSIGGTISDANLTWSTTTSSTCRLATFRSFVGDSKWYAEAKVVSLASATASIVGIMANGGGNYLGRITTDLSASVGDTINVAYDPTTGKIFYGVNNTWIGSGDPATGANPFSTLTGTELNGAVFAVGVNTVTSGTTTFSVNFGQRPFTYTPPTGFVALNTYNLPTSTIIKGNTVMDATLYTGNSSTQTITNAGAFKPDFVWIKNRSTASQHVLTDSVRGITKQLFSSNTNAEQTSATGITALNSNGFSLGANVSPTGSTNSSPDSYVGWQWLESASAGFDIVTFTGNGGGQTFAHNLGVAPGLMICKSLNNAQDWYVYHSSIGGTGALSLNTTAATATSVSYWSNVTPGSSTFSVGGNFSSGYTYVNYLFAPIAGYSAFGSYTGNGSADGPFVYTGFRPKWLTVKRTDTAGTNWLLQDSVRGPYNLTENTLYPNLSDAEATGAGYFDLLSNGFKLRTSGTGLNASGGTYIYMAFAENPFRNALAR